MDISVVVPLYNEEESLLELLAWIDRVMQANSFSYEVVLVDDGSNDTSWAVIEDLQTKYSSVRGIKFRRNYGKSAALFSGFEIVKGDVVPITSISLPICFYSFPCLVPYSCIFCMPASTSTGISVKFGYFNCYIWLYCAIMRAENAWIRSFTCIEH